MRGKSTFRSIATILIVIAIAAQLARILSLGGRNDTTPFFSANDRSRWCTVASLVEDGCYEIDRVIQLSDDGKRRPWYTIDMVRHVGRDGQLHYYSSKPPLLATLYAGVYACIYYSTGIKLTEHPFYVGRIILIVVNLLPLAWFWWWASRWIEREVRGTWARVVFLSFVLFGTFLTTFASTMNNHLPGALAVAASMAIGFNSTSRLRRVGFGRRRLVQPRPLRPLVIFQPLAGLECWGYCSGSNAASRRVYLM